MFPLKVYQRSLQRMKEWGGGGGGVIICDTELSNMYLVFTNFQISGLLDSLLYMDAISNSPIVFPSAPLHSIFFSPIS